MANLNPEIVNEIPVHDPTNYHPVLLIWTARTCTHCNKLYQRWDELKARLLGLNPNLRIVINVNAYTNLTVAPPLPACLNFFARWVPNIIYIPGHFWNLAVTDPTYVLREGVQIMSGIIESDRVNFVENNEYQVNDVDSIIAWLADIIVPDIKEPEL
jgi:hypothetical protein